MGPNVEEIKISTLTTENPVETNKYSIQVLSNSLNEFRFSFNNRKVIYLIYEFKADKKLKDLKPSSEDLEKELRDFLKKYKIRNIIYPTNSGDLFITIDAVDEINLPKHLKNSLYELNRKQSTPTKVF